MYNEKYPKNDYDEGDKWKKAYNDHLKNEKTLGDNFPSIFGLRIKCPACKKIVKIIYLDKKNPNYCLCWHCQFRFIIPEGLLNDRFGKVINFDDLIDFHEELNKKEKTK